MPVVPAPGDKRVVVFEPVVFIAVRWRYDRGDDDVEAGLVMLELGKPVPVVEEGLPPSPAAKAGAVVTSMAVAIKA